MQLINFLIPILSTVFGFLIPINSLNSKTNLGRTFFTDEQRIKVRYYNTFIFSLIMAFGIAYFSLVLQVKISNNSQIKPSEMSSSLSWGIIFFLIFLMVTSPLMRWVENFFIKSHLKYKVVFPNPIGEIYILRMHDSDTCICSRNPNAEFIHNQSYILVPMEKIKEKDLIQEKITKPPCSFWSKLFYL